MANSIVTDQTASLPPSILVLFGITGDLARRKVMPALYHLIKDNLLPAHFEIIGTSRQALTIDDLLKEIELCVLEVDNICDPDALQAFRQRLRLVKLDPANLDDYDILHQTLDAIETEHGVCMNRLYYLSIPPQVYGSVVRSLGERGLNQGCQHGQAESRLLVEKPFGYDYASAEKLIAITSAAFLENQVLRIDHYLAKETAQNILTFRQRNPLFASIWSNRNVKSIDIVAYEKIGIEGRIGFYERVGALRDLIQSHLIQLLTLTTMELPATNGDDTEATHAAKQTLLNAVLPPAPHEITSRVVRAQYEGYRDEVNNPDSMTETFVSLQLEIDNDRWQGVPIRLRTGKAMATKRTEITLSFGHLGPDAADNKLTFRIQPNEGIDVQLLVKKPGFDNAVYPAKMDFSYQKTFDDHGHPDAYERVLIDAIRGDHTLFATSQAVLASWRILQPILDHWAKDNSDLHLYRQNAPVSEILSADVLQ
jgi:glucose-6-phosphate 1-dehydrogenase